MGTEQHCVCCMLSGLLFEANPELVTAVTAQANFMEALLTTGYKFSPTQWSNIVVVKRLGQPPAEVTICVSLLKVSKC